MKSGGRGRRTILAAAPQLLPLIFYYRDKDGREIDFVLVQDQLFCPLEVKKSASPGRDWAAPFAALARLDRQVGESGVLCLCREVLPLTEQASAIPIGVIEPAPRPFPHARGLIDR